MENIQWLYCTHKSGNKEVLLNFMLLLQQNVDAEDNKLNYPVIYFQRAFSHSRAYTYALEEPIKIS